MSNIHNIEAEQVILGAIIMDSAIFRALSLRAEHFFDPVHRVIFEKIASRLDSGKGVDGISLKGFFENEESFSELGGIKYLARLMGEACSNTNAKDYANLIKGMAMRRALEEYGAEVQRVAGSGDDALAHAQDGLGELLKSQHGGAVFVNSRDAAEAAIADLTKHIQEGTVPGLTTGIQAFDNQTGMMHSGELIVIAGATSSGKTTLACNIAFNAARHCESVLFFSKEMNQKQLAYREISRSARIHGHFNIPYADLARARLTEDQLEQVNGQHKALPFNLVINEHHMMSVQYIREACYQHGGKIGLIVVDYLQILITPAARGKSRAETIGDMTRDLKTLAKEFDCPVLLLCQINRGVDGRDDKVPRVSDLKESGSIEQDADQIWLIYREFYYLSRSQPAKMDAAEWHLQLDACRNQIDIIQGKARMGATGTIRLFCEIQYGLVKDIEQ